MTLYTKENCSKCDHVKQAFNLERMGIKVKVISFDDAEVLADLAWYELIDSVEQGALPILLLDDGSHIKYELPIRRYLEQKLQPTTH